MKKSAFKVHIKTFYFHKAFGRSLTLDVNLYLFSAILEAKKFCKNNLETLSNSKHNLLIIDVYTVSLISVKELNNSVSVVLYLTFEAYLTIQAALK